MLRLLQISFLYPNFLWALFLLLVPIVIHLISIRRFQRQEFSDITLLKEISQQGMAKRKIRDWLILILRVLLLSCLILAFAVPFKVRKEEGRKQKHWIVVDTSLGMAAEKSGEDRFSIVKSAASHLLNQLDPQSEVVVTGYDLDRLSMDPTSIDQAKKLLENLDLSAFSAEVRDLMYLFAEKVNEDSLYHHHIYWFTDLQDSLPLKMLPSDVDFKLFHVPSGLEFNLSVDSVWFEQPLRKIRGEEKLIVQVSNNAQDLVEKLKVSTLVNGIPEIHLIDIPPQAQVLDTFSFLVPEGPWVNLSVEISDPSFTFDNTYQLNYELQRKSKVLVITESDTLRDVLSSIFRGEEQVTMDFSSPNDLKVTEMSDYEVLILGELQKMESGLLNLILDTYSRGRLKVILLSEPSGDLTSYQEFMSLFEVAGEIVRDSAVVRIRQVEEDN